MLAPKEAVQDRAAVAIGKLTEKKETCPSFSSALEILAIYLNMSSTFTHMHYEFLSQHFMDSIKIFILRQKNKVMSYRQGVVYHSLYVCKNSEEQLYNTTTKTYIVVSCDTDTLLFISFYYIYLILKDKEMQ